MKWENCCAASSIGRTGIVNWVLRNEKLTISGLRSSFRLRIQQGAHMTPRARLNGLVDLNGHWTSATALAKCRSALVNHSVENRINLKMVCTTFQQPSELDRQPKSQREARDSLSEFHGVPLFACLVDWKIRTQSFGNKHDPLFTLKWARLTSTCKWFAFWHFQFESFTWSTDHSWLMCESGYPDEKSDRIEFRHSEQWLRALRWTRAPFNWPNFSGLVGSTIRHLGSPIRFVDLFSTN